MTLSTDHSFWRERRAEMELDWCPYAYQPNALLLGQTSSQHQIYDLASLLIFLFFCLKWKSRVFMKCHGMCVDGGVPVWSLCLKNRFMSIILTLCLCFYWTVIWQERMRLLCPRRCQTRWKISLTWGNCVCIWLLLWTHSWFNLILFVLYLWAGIIWFDSVFLIAKLASV